jgi:predicted nucleic acid-binding protein
MPRFAPRCALKVKKIADAGLIIAALDERDAHHGWAARLLGRESPPWLVCEPVLAEIAASIGTPEPVLEMLQVGDLELAFDLDENRAEVLALVKKYRDQEMDLADACVVRMSELYEDSVVYTVDRKDFIVYRRQGRRPVRSIFPD